MEHLKVVLVICVVLGVSLARPQGEHRCSSPADIVFILDSSTSIWYKDFKRQTKFVSDVMNNFDIGPGPEQTRVGVMTFGHLVWKKFDLNATMNTNKDDMMARVNALEHDIGTRTNTGAAIKYAVSEMFTRKAGNRPGVPRIAIVITDGRSQKHFETALAAQKAHDSGITMFAIGVGERLDQKELSDIASDPDSDYKFLVQDFSALSKITDKLTAQTCEATKAPLSTTTTPVPTTTTMSTTTTPVQTTTVDQSDQADCGGKPAEVFFVVDSSGSIDRKDFNTEIEFVKNVIDIFDIGKNKTRVGVISFSNNADLVLGLDNNLSKEHLKKTVTNIRHVGGGTNTAEALNVLRRKGFAKKVVRENVPKIAVFLTDGLSADEDRTAQEARLTHHTGIKVFAIGIGHGVDLIEMKRIASDPDDDYRFQVDDFNSLDSIRARLAYKTCDVTPETVKDEPASELACTVRENTDLMFIYDVAALGEEKSRAISMFLTTVVSQLDLLSGQLHVGRVTDNCPSGGNFQLSSKVTSADFSNIRLSTFSHLIKKVIRTGFTSEYGGRDNSKNAGVIFIDSEMDSLDGDTIHEVNRLSKDAEVFVVAMGNNRIIQSFSKSFRESRFIHLNSVRDLDSAAMELLAKLCSFFESDSSFDISPQ